MEQLARAPVRIVGSYLSPYVRKVLVALEWKSVPYEIDPIVPFFGDERFSRASPIRRIPVLIDDRASLADSSVICQYLEDRYPEPALYPADIADRALDRRRGDRLLLPQRRVARYEVDRARWPRTAAWVERTLALPAFAKLLPFEQKSARTPIPKQREALREIGAPLTAESWFTATPRRGMMKI